jgi:hypothetical protein
MEIKQKVRECWLCVILFACVCVWGGGGGGGASNLTILPPIVFLGDFRYF